ncbi:hypothetical protein FB45DRAFT_1065451 [Roridomyces roridus]|uniref:DUF6534 domain-containing protein n=1 Tax=Roridomyces roridus TaxID=1738132 RepID=A0AAD7B7H2_9AGAR|nr:hypothetical protein FB45DRAFT_1065451 [Roridomyces roridus]
MSAPGLPPGAPDPAAAAAALAAAIAEVKEVFGTSFIGFAVATTVYGIALLQIYLYLRHYPKDSIHLKLTVGLLWLFDTLSTIMVAHSLYTYFVLNFGDIAADAKVPWSFALENGFLTMVTITAQSYYSWQIWNISNGNISSRHDACPRFMWYALLFVSYFWSIAHRQQDWGFISPSICTSTSPSPSFSEPLLTSPDRNVLRFQDPTVASISTHHFRAVSGPVQGTAAVCDILIMLSLIYYLRSKRRSGIRTTEDMIDTLILYSMCRGIVTAITQILFLGLNVGIPDHTYWQPFHQLVGKLYVNSILASLNVRRVILGRGDPENSERTTKSTSRATGSTGTMPLAFLRPKTDTEMTGDNITFDHAHAQGHSNYSQDQDREEMEMGTPVKKAAGILPGS